jgi:hypothetical protein
MSGVESMPTRYGRPGDNLAGFHVAVQSRG